MAYDEGLATRIRDILMHHPDAEEKKMFGGLCFMIAKHMCCGIIGDTLIVRVGPKNYEMLLAKPSAKEMDFTGRAMKGMIYVDPEGISEDAELDEWIMYCLEFVERLPPKAPRKKK